MDEKIQVLNQMITIIDEKATIFKKNKTKLPKVAYESEKQILTKTIQDTIQLAESIKPTPFSLIQDLKSLLKQL